MKTTMQKQTNNNKAVEKYIPAANRKKIAPDDFAGPNRSFPIRNQEDVDSAARLIGHADNPDEVKRKVIEIAHRKGLKIPDAWQGKKEEKAAKTGEFRKSFVIEKIDTDQRLVYGIASSPDIDDQDDTIDPNALERALPDYMKWANLREMHSNNAVGVVQKAEVVDGKLFITAKVVDDDAWQKVKEGVFKGFSIGGKIIKSVIEKVDGKAVRRILELALSEISLVDRPANPEAKILAYKGANMNLDTATDATQAPDELVIAEGEESTTPEEEKQEAIPVAKASSKTPDPMAIVTDIQALRNQYELDGNTDAAQMLTGAIGQLMAAAQDQTADTSGGDGDGDPIEGQPVQDDDGDGVDMAAGPIEDDTPIAGDGEDDGQGVAGSRAKKDSVTMASQIVDLLKSGRVFSSANENQLHTAHDALAKALGLGCSVAKDAGDGVSMAAGKKDDLKKSSVTSNDDKVLAAVTEIAKRLERLEKQPVSGGPVVSSAVSKTLAGGLDSSSEVTTIGDRINLLRKAQQETANPFVKSSIGEEIARLEINRVMGFSN